MQYISNATEKIAREIFQSESECCFHRKDGGFILKDDSENYFRYTYAREREKNDTKTQIIKKKHTKQETR